jgi:hypothetical protein
MLDLEKPTWATPVRVMILASASAAWYDTTDAERREAVLPRFREILSSWARSGARLIGSFDDDFFMVGTPTSLPNSMYMLYEIDDVSRVVDMLHMLRQTERGVRLDKYIRMEARLGRPVYLLDN